MKILKHILPLLLLLPIMTRGQQLNFVHHNEALPDLYFVFNQPEYVAGDTAFFKAYLVGENLKIHSGKAIMDIALFKGDVRFLHQRIIITDTETAGYLSLPLKIQSGVYTIMVILNGFEFEAEFIISGDQQYAVGTTMKFKSSQLSAQTDFHDGPYQTNKKATVNIDISKSAMPQARTIAVSILREGLFDQSNVIAFKSSPLSDSEVVKENFPVFFSGKVVDSEESKVPDSVKLTFYLNRNDLVYPVYANKNGEFRFPLFKNFGSDEIFYTVNNRGRKDDHLKIVLKDFKRSSGIAFDEKVTGADAYWDFSNKRKIIADSYQYFLNENTPFTKNNQSEDFLADHEINLEKYETFATMSELIINILPAVKLKKNAKRETVRIFLKESAQVAAGDPIYIIDGVMTDSTEYFLSLNPNDIKEVKILRSSETLRRFGDMGRNGIIIIKSRIADGLTIPRPVRSLFITGINPNASFNNTVLDANRSNPDVRSCLYWNPDLTLDESGHGTLLFSTGAITGPIKLIIQGVLSDGSLFYYEDMGVIHFATP